MEALLLGVALIAVSLWYAARHPSKSEQVNGENTGPSKSVDPMPDDSAPITGITQAEIEERAELFKEFMHLCKILDDGNIYQVVGDPSFRLKETVETETKRYLLSLAIVDGVITDGEVNYLNCVFGVNYSKEGWMQETKNFESMTTPPPGIRLYIDVTRQLRPDGLYSIPVTFDHLIAGMMRSDGRTSQKQIDLANRYIEEIKSYTYQ